MYSKKPILIAMFGQPGSGKTYFAEHLSKHERVFHLSADRVRFSILKKPTFTKEENQALFSFMDALVAQLLEMDVSVIYDANFNLKKHRNALQKLVERSGGRYVLVFIKTDEAKSRERIIKRSKLKSKNKKLLYRPITKSVFDDLKNEMELPTSSERVIEIDGHVPFKKQLLQFKQALRECNF